MNEFLEDILVEAAMQSIGALTDRMKAEGRFVGQAQPTPQEHAFLVIVQEFLDFLVERNEQRRTWS